MNNTSQFDVATAALEHLELLNHSNQNPLEIAAQFRTLLRSKKYNKHIHSSDINYTYADYIAADATIRRQGRAHSQVDHRSKPLGRIEYNLNDDQFKSDLHSSYDIAKCEKQDDSIEDGHADSAIGSDSSDLARHKIDSSALSQSTSTRNNEMILLKTSKHKGNSNRFQYPTINWKQLREKQYENKLDKVKKFLSTKFKTIRLSRAETTDLTTVSSVTCVTDKIDPCTYSNMSDLRKSSETNATERDSRSSSSSSTSTSSRCRSLSSHSIRTPSISPINSPRSTYTVSRFNSTAIDQNDGDILFPIADCNLLIKHHFSEQKKGCSPAKDLYNQNEIFFVTKKETISI